MNANRRTKNGRPENEAITFIHHHRQLARRFLGAKTVTPTILTALCQLAPCGFSSESIHILQLIVLAAVLTTLHKFNHGTKLMYTQTVQYYYSTSTRAHDDVNKNYVIMCSCTSIISVKIATFLVGAKKKKKNWNSIILNLIKKVKHHC